MPYVSAAASLNVTVLLLVILVLLTSLWTPDGAAKDRLSAWNATGGSGCSMLRLPNVVKPLMLQTSVGEPVFVILCFNVYGVCGPGIQEGLINYRSFAA